MSLETRPDAIAIEVSNVTRTFALARSASGDARTLRAVDGVSLRVRAGEVLGIVGESGCGKSTLARLILGSLPPNAGHILVEGCDLRTLDRRARARLIQPVFQDPYSSLNPAHRVRDIVRLPLAAQGDMAKRAQTNAVAEVLERVGLSVAIGDRYPAELSGGQRQRVAIARALVLKPRIVVCDEPTSALDVSVQAQVLNLLAQLQRELGLTLIFISHNLGVVDHIASRVAVMYLGRIVELAPADALFETPRHPYTRVLLSSVLTPEAGKGIPEIALGDGYPDPSNIPRGCRFHPRCPAAIDACSTIEPTEALAGDHLVECLLAEAGEHRSATHSRLHRAAAASHVATAP